MREIRFRAWDEKNQAMIYPKGILFDGRVVNFMCGMLEPFDGYKLMQYTGLKDKNGREIYEGDVLGRVSPHTGLKHSYTVEWDEKHARFMSCGKRFQEHISASIERGCEVIGNIYENPELLKGEETT